MLPCITVLKWYLIRMMGYIYLSTTEGLDVVFRKRRFAGDVGLSPPLSEPCVSTRCPWALRALTYVNVQL